MQYILFENLATAYFSFDIFKSSSTIQIWWIKNHVTILYVL